MADRDLLDETLRERLGTLHIEAPVADGLAGVHDRYRRRRRRHRRVAASAALASVALVVAVAYLVARPGSGPTIVTDSHPATTPAPGPTGDTRPGASPATEDPSVRVEPDALHRDGDTVTVTVPTDLPADWLNDPPRVCAVVDGRETCGPFGRVDGYEAVDSSGDSSTARLVVHRAVFTPTGWRDCDDDGVVCRVVVPARDGTYRASTPLRFEGPRVARDVELAVSPEVVDETLQVELHPSGLTTDPSWTEWVATHSTVTPPVPAFRVDVCRFAGDDVDCDYFAGGDIVDADAPDEPTTLAVRSDLFGQRGWYDCAAGGCFVVVRATRWQGGDLFDDVGVAAAPLPFESSVPAAPRPTIEVAPPGPHEPGDQVTVTARHAPRGRTAVQLELCIGDAAQPGTCGFMASSETGLEAEYTFAPLPPGEIRSPLCSDEVPCTVRLRPAQEGAPPLATEPIALSGSAARARGGQ